jgi:cytochrome P450
MARFSDGIEHARRRVLLEQLLPESTPLETAARRWVAAAAQRGPETWDVMPLARAVPVLVLAEALGVPAGQLRRVGDLVGRLCDALAPSLGVPGCEPGGDEAARQLPPLLADIGPWSAELTVAVVGLLFQARDATAALIGAAMLTGASATDTESGTAASVEVALREAAPVQCTRRTSVEDLSLGGATVPAGAPVWVILAAAEQGMPHPPATFGAGPHACPGADHAVALARGVLAGLAAAGWRPVPEQPVRYEARPNLRMPAAVLVYRP